MKAGVLEKVKRGEKSATGWGEKMLEWLKENSWWKSVCYYVLLMINSRQEGVSAEFRDHTFPPVLPEKVGGGPTQTSVAR